MAIKLVNVKLKDGVDQNSFVSEFDSVSEVSVNNLLPNIPTLVVFNVEESYLSTLQSHSSVEVAEEEAQAFPSVTYPSQPSTYTLSGKNVQQIWFIVAYLEQILFHISIILILILCKKMELTN